MVLAHKVAAPSRLEDHRQLPPQGLDGGVGVGGPRLKWDDLDGHLEGMDSRNICSVCPETVIIQLT